MFFDDINSIEEIAKNTGCAIFVLPKNQLNDVEIKNALKIEPEAKATISIEQVRKITALLNSKERHEQYIIIRPAEALNASSGNALLKNLEEPGEHYHFVLVTSNPSQILPTILSRSLVYFLRTDAKLDSEIIASEEIKTLARKYIIATPKDLPALAETITKKKDDTRGFALEVLGVTIEMLYKSYFKTKNQVFVKKIPKFLEAYSNIEKNGHLKLHLVADLI
jgi:hypothetical protein